MRMKVINFYLICNVQSAVFLSVTTKLNAYPLYLCTLIIDTFKFRQENIYNEN